MSETYNYVWTYDELKYKVGGMYIVTPQDNNYFQCSSSPLSQLSITSHDAMSTPLSSFDPFVVTVMHLSTSSWDRVEYCSSLRIKGVSLTLCWLIEAEGDRFLSSCCRRDSWRDVNSSPTA